MTDIRISVREEYENKSASNISVIVNFMIKGPVLKTLCNQRSKKSLKSLKHCGSMKETTINRLKYKILSEYDKRIKQNA